MATTAGSRSEDETRDGKKAHGGQEAEKKQKENVKAERETERRDDGADGDRHGAAQPARVPLSRAMRLAAEQLAELLQCEPGSVSSVQPTQEGWTADVEIVEVERIPETTSVMASYRVQLDTQGNLLGYDRTRRYARGQIDQRR